jgi:hypothetical protein
MMWYPAKGAFRAGKAEGNEWDDAYIGLHSTAMGHGTKASGSGSTAIGSGTEASGTVSTALGAGTEASALGSTAIGDQAEAHGNASTAIGYFATTRGWASTAIGRHVTANGDYSTAMGNYASTAWKRGSFVYGDASAGDNLVAAGRDNQFVVRAAGGTVFFSNSALSSGVVLQPGGGAWGTISDRNRKDDFREVNAEVVLQRIAAMPIQSWSYKSQDPSVRHIGPTAQDFYAAFHLGESDTTITTTDIDGVTMLAIQALERRTAEVSALRTEVAELRSLVEQLMRQSSTPREEER